MFTNLVFNFDGYKIEFSASELIIIAQKIIDKKSMKQSRNISHLIKK